MSYQLESTFSKALTKKLKEIPNSWFIRVEIKYIRGIPDRIGCVNGRFVALETKKCEKEALEKSGRVLLQRVIIKKIQEAGGFADFIYPENCQEILTKLAELQ